MTKDYPDFSDLFDELPYAGEPPFQPHSWTSEAAARSIEHRKINAMHWQIIRYLQRYPNGATDERLQEELAMAANTERPRRRELQLGDYIADSGRVAPTRSGRHATIWILVTLPEGELQWPSNPTSNT